MHFKMLLSNKKGSGNGTVSQCWPIGNYWLVLFNQSDIYRFCENIPLLVSSVIGHHTGIHLPEPSSNSLFDLRIGCRQRVYKEHSRLSTSPW